ncbi:MAG TPA: type II secretion system F family protein [Bacteroidia bacterium]|jgi:type IV pilus assembly protein PilC|nr:type II secretion system F family protein [Bacteroidia bacterium]
MASIDISKYSPKNVTNSVKEVSIGENLSKVLSTEIKLFEKKFGQKQKEWFYTEVGLLLTAGVDVKTAFEIIENETKEKKHKALIVQIKNDVISGSSIAGALTKHSKIFTNYECQSVRIGEETGKLPEVLSELGKFYNGAIKLRRQIIGTLTYPIVVITMAILIVYFMLSFVVPMFSDVFKQTGGRLPASTQFLISVSGKSTAIFYSLLLIVGGFILLHKTQSKKIWYRQYTSAAFLKIPLINNLIKKIYLARFCQSMRLLLGAKVLLIEALALVRNMIEYYPIEHALETVEKEVLAGKTLNESLSAHSIFPQKLTALIKVSEEVNAPELIFEKLSKQYSEEIEHQQAVVGKVIEPFFIVVLGLIIGFILVAMYMPMFQLSKGF